MTGYLNYYPHFPRGWTDRAKCKGKPTNDYDVNAILGPAYIQPTSKDHAALREKAEALCAGCPVKPECADHALTDQATGMVYAGVPIPNRNNNEGTKIRIEMAYAELQKIAAPLKKRKK